MKLLVIHGHRELTASTARPDKEPVISDECQARGRAAEALALQEGIDCVLFCDAGDPGHPSEAEQMANAWAGPAVRKLLDEQSSDTAYNAAVAFRVCRELEVKEVWVVSSLWHLRLPFYYRPFKLHGIEVRCYRLAFSFSKLPARLWHEVYWARYAPTARWLAYAEVLSLPGPMLECRREPGRAGERA